MTRQVFESLRWRGRDLTPHLAELDDPGWTVIPCDPDLVVELRKLMRALERTEGWHVRTDYDQQLSQLSVARSKPL